MRHTKFIMGTAVTLDIPGTSDNHIFKEVFDRLREIDEQFSPYKKTSELCRLQRGELAQKKLSTDMKRIIRACKKAEADTDGYFSARYSGEFEPSGYVKGWAIDQAQKMLESAGHKTFCVSIGGDLAAKSSGQKTWSIGLQDPFDKAGYIGKLSGKNFAIATSGSYERGQHIVNPKTGKPAGELVSLSVFGPKIIKADILATAGFACGYSFIKLVEKHTSYEALAITKNSAMLATKGVQDFIEL